MKIVGLDLSLSRTGFALMTNGVLQFGSIQTDSQQQLEVRILRVLKTLQNFGWPYTFAFIENHAFSQNSGHARDRAELTGVIKHYLSLANTEMFLVAPNALKKWVTGYGGSRNQKVEKSTILHCVAKKMDVEPRNDDEADAIALADFGYHYLCPDGSLRRSLVGYEKDILAAFNKPKVKKTKESRFRVMAAGGSL